MFLDLTTSRRPGWSRKRMPTGSSATTAATRPHDAQASFTRRAPAGASGLASSIDGKLRACHGLRDRLRASRPGHMPLTYP
jgi:hypothetical protein